MYGWLFECLKSMIISRYGETLWLEIRVDANVDTPSWVNDGYYPDDIFHKLTRSFSEVVSITEDNVSQRTACSCNLTSHSFRPMK